MLVQRCRESDYDTASQSCAAPFWSPDTGGLPSLSVSDAFTVGGSILALWAVAFGVRAVARLVHR